MNQLRVILAIIKVQLKQRRGCGGIDVFSYLLPAAGAAVFAWLARQSNDPTVATYVLIGVPLMGISGGLIFNVGWALSNEISWGTLEFALISPTSTPTSRSGALSLRPLAKP